VVHFLTEANESNSYLVIDPPSGKCVLIDAGGFDSRIKDMVKGEDLDFLGVFVTHDHYDHTDGIREALGELGGLVFAKSARDLTSAVGDGDMIEIGELKAQVLETPGHTPDSISLLIGPAVFTGDCLFAGSVGGTSSKENHQQQLRSIQSKILVLPDDTRVYPGHGPATTVGIERAYNPFLIHL
jgi:glyoxylase-like metal-dependent hydrolase (beta-lactamase superfamily II)